MLRTKAIVQKEIIHILRDRRTLMMIVGMPLLQLILYGYGINQDVKHIKTVVYNEDHSALSRRLEQSFVQSSYFDIEKHVSSPKEFRQAIDRGPSKAGLHIPPDFAKELLAGRNVPLQLAIDGTDSTPANAAMNSSTAIIQAFMLKEGLLPVQALPIDYRPRMWYNPDLKTPFFMVPGLIGLLLQILIPTITATAIVREKEHGNIEQLMVTPIKPWELMLGKLIPYTFIGLLIAASIVIVAQVLFHIPIRGSMFTLFLLTLLFIVVCLGFGLLVSTVAENQQQASQMIMFLVPPSILLSGYIFPREGMPLPIYAFSYLIPLTYYVTIVRGIILKGLGFMDLWKDILPLIAMAIFIMTVSIKKFHKRLS